MNVRYEEVKCEVKECVYNDHGHEVCELDSIQIGEDGLGDTDCLSFKSSSRESHK